MLARWLNTAWKWKCSREAAALRRAATRVADTQSELLHELLATNRDTEYGRRYDFASIGTPREFQRRVPICTYDDLQPYIDRIAGGQPNVLTRDKVLLLEPTSGTTSGEKLIPYTAALRREFQRGIAAWIYDLFTHRPAVCRGRAYWSISPALGPGRKTSGGIPIGFDDDAAYLGRLEQWAMRHLLAVPSSVAKLPGIDQVRYATLRHLLLAKDLSLISVWSSTFLTSLLASLRGVSERLVADLRRSNFKRADEMQSLLRSGASDAELYRQLWPQLAVISCWSDASAALFLPQVQRLFPQVEIQPKGLLATEAFVSLPLVGQSGAALAVWSHFFEFAQGDEFRLAHELDAGDRYRVIVTTGGGLYRYDLRDEVEVVGFIKQCPLLRFVGRTDRTCDLVGEKLSEQHVQAALDAACESLRLEPSFALLAPVLETPPHYQLYVQGLPPGAVTRLAEELQVQLEVNPYYRHAVQVGQLGPIEAVLLDLAERSGWSLYECNCLARGQKAGNIKPAVLDRGTHWASVFGKASGAGFQPAMNQ